MSLPTPTLPTVSFDSGNQTKLYVAKASTYDESAGLSTSDELTVVGGDISFTPSGSVETVPVYGNTWDRSVKNGISGTFNATTHAPGTDTVVADLIEMAQAVGEAAQCVYILELPDGGYIDGAAVVESFTPNTPVRGVFSYSFSFTTDGEVNYTAPA